MHRICCTYVATCYIQQGSFGNTSNQNSWRHAATPQVEYSWGATEVKASLPGVGAIVDITETGSSLRANKLRVC